MTVFSKINQVEGFISHLRFVHPRAIRAFRLPSSNRLDDQHRTSARKITKKKYSELPNTCVLPDGANAAPLADWQGGLPLPGVRKRSVKRSKRLSTDTTLDATQASDDKPAEKSSRTTQPRNQLATEILQNLSKFPHCILLTRVGQFYESYFDQAEEVSRLLNIKLTHRTWDKRRVLMCGFPLAHLDKFLKILVHENKRFVALCEEFPRSPLGAKDGFDRRVARIITPGTLIDESFLNPYEDNYLLAIGFSPKSLQDEGAAKESTNSTGLAWIDISTGEFFTNSCTFESLRDEITRIGPREIVLDKELNLDAHSLRQMLLDEGNFVSYIIPSDVAIPTASSVAGGYFDDPASTCESSHFLPSFALTPEETIAVKLLTTFLHANLLDHMPQLVSPRKQPAEGRMHIDSHTLKSLEIRESMAEGGTKGSMLSVVKRTVTSSGTRLLARWLCSPSTSIAEIMARQSLVSFFHTRLHLREDLTKILANVKDVARTLQKLLLGRGDPSDLLSIRETICVWDSIKQHIELEKEMELRERGSISRDEWASIDTLISRMSDLRGLTNRIGAALSGDQSEDSVSPAIGVNVENSSADFPESSRITWRYGQDKWALKPEFSDTLMTLHATLKELLRRKDELEQELQQSYKAPSLTLRSSPGQGMHVHIQRAKRDHAKISASPLFVNISETGSTKCFFYKEWSVLGGQIVDATVAIFTAEKETFQSLRSEVNALALPLRRNARLLDELDVALAFANLAAELNFVKPCLKNDMSYELVNGRHPTVEIGLLAGGRVFTPNSVLLSPSSRVHILTGPNMAGKSTFLRQIALIAILAQTGSFVPADHAIIGIVDRLFSRVGAKDDVFRDRSTFMVEMLETSEILRRATPRSLVIMDEVGRGTTVKDGLAIAFATIHHLVSKNQCRALFATHFHELSDMLGCLDSHRGSGVFQDVAFFCTSVDETDEDHFTYSYSVKPGVNHDSHGLKVAQLAGMPDSALTTAKHALLWLKSRRAEETLQAVDLKTLNIR